MRAAVALNLAACSAADQILASDGDERVRLLLTRKMLTLLPNLSSAEQDRLRDQTFGVLSTLVQDEAIRIRVLIAEVLAELPDVPHALILTLAQDAAIPVSEPVLRLSRCFRRRTCSACCRRPRTRPPPPPSPTGPTCRRRCPRSSPPRPTPSPSARCLPTRPLPSGKARWTSLIARRPCSRTGMRPSSTAHASPTTPPAPCPRSSPPTCWKCWPTAPTWGRPRSPRSSTA
ncbi:MAG: hypothetical protein WDN49_00205 [Acetobacteraceae bacterium]